MTDSIFINFAILLVVGLLFSKLAKLVKFPNVTGYLIGGLLIGPAIPELLKYLGLDINFLGIISRDSLKGLELICEISLGFIAFTIGNEFKISYFKQVGIKPFIIAMFEAVFAAVFVFIAVMLFQKGAPFALVIAAISSATAPAATVMVVKQYKARGPLTKTLLSVVAIDDAVALIIFGFNYAIAMSLLNANANAGSTNLVLSLLQPFLEIILSLVLGAVLGILAVLLVKWFKGRSNRICVILGMILLDLGLVMIINNQFGMNVSTLLSAMMIGAMLANLSRYYDDIIPLVERFTPPFFMLFFVISGAQLNLTAIGSIGLVGIAYVVIRSIGKCVGAFLGAKVAKSEPSVQKYLGPCLIPQAGVALGLSLIAVRTLGEQGEQIRTIILCATLIYELIGPYIAKIALSKAKEINIETTSKKYKKQINNA